MCSSRCLFSVPPEAVNHSLAQNNATCRWLHTSNQLDESCLCQSLFPVWLPLVFPELPLFPTQCKMMQNQISSQKNKPYFSERENLLTFSSVLSLLQSISSDRGNLFCVGHFPSDSQSRSCNLVLALVLFSHMTHESGRVEASFALTEMRGRLFNSFLLLAT